MTFDLGVYLGNGPDGVARLPAFTSAIGRAPDLALDFLAEDSFASELSDASWAVPAWAKAGVKKLCLSIPFLTNEDQSLANVAAGKHDATFKAIADGVRAAGFAGRNVIWRPDWEYNSGWEKWGNETSAATLQAHIAAFQHGVGILKNEIPDSLVFQCWAGGWQQIDPTTGFAGKPFVDIVGFDLYPTVWGTNNPTTAQCQAFLTQGWQLGFIEGYAHDLGLPFAIGELGIGDRPNGTDNYGPGDNGELAAWVMAQLIGTKYGIGYGPGQLAFGNLWNINAGDYNSDLATRPNVLAAYKAALSQSAPSRAAFIALLTALRGQVAHTNTKAMASLDQALALAARLP